MPAARKLAKPGTLIGTGSAPEGINQNYVMYDFMSEMSLNEAPVDIDQWYTVSKFKTYLFFKKIHLFRNP